MHWHERNVILASLWQYNYGQTYTQNMCPSLKTAMHLVNTYQTEKTSI